MRLLYMNPRVSDREGIRFEIVLSSSINECMLLIALNP